MKLAQKYFSLFLFFLWGNLFACDCYPLDSIKESIKKSDIIIRGKIIKVNYDKIIFNSKNKFDTSTLINEYKVVIIKKYGYPIITH